MPKAFVYGALILLTLALIPPALIARARTRQTENRRIHFIQDMDNQSRFRAQHTNPMFADGRAMRPLVPGAVARGEAGEDVHYEHGVVHDGGGGWAATFPAAVDVTMDFVRHGRERFEIYCTPCHGQAGYGDGIIHRRAMELVANPQISAGTTWVAPKSLHDADVRDQPPGQVFNTVSNGVRNMSGYAAQIPTADRWAIVAYVKALQRSQNARPTDVPPNVRRNLKVIDLVPEEGQ